MQNTYYIIIIAIGAVIGMSTIVIYNLLKDIYSKLTSIQIIITKQLKMMNVNELPEDSQTMKAAETNNNLEKKIEAMHTAIETLITELANVQKDIKNIQAIQKDHTKKLADIYIEE